MVKQTNNKIVREIDKLENNESLAVLAYITELLSIRISNQTETQLSDDLIASLAETRENQRARQVVEWEKVRRRNNYQRAV